MRTRTLGRTGIRVGELSLGTCFATGGPDGFRGAVPIVRRAFEGGITLVDTSADYGDSEAALGAALHELNHPCTISTKIGPRTGEAFDARGKPGLRRVVEESLALLHRDTLDTLMIHEPDRPGQFDWFADPMRFHGPVTELLAELRAEGLIRFTGIGGTTVRQLALLAETGEYDVVLTAFNSSPLWREALEGVLPAAAAHDMGVMLASPTQQGWLAQRFDEAVRHGARWLHPLRRAQLLALYDLLDETGIEIPALCIRWAIAVPGVSTVLTGPRAVAQLEQNLAAAEAGPLPPDVATRLDEIAAMLPMRPYGEPFFCALGDASYWGPGPA
jgi:aryl-alcohol dehydrogenase-like predicted oxidoreductase